MMKPKNPFLLKGYISPKYFCDREKETEYLTQAIKNERNVSLISWRRLGKTNLIRHVFHQLKSEKDIMLIYADIYGTENFSAFIRILSSAALEAITEGSTNILKKILKSFTQIHPEVGFDPLTGNPSFSLNIKNEKEADATLESLLQVLKNYNKKIIIAIDEFQQIISYPEKNTEAKLRSVFQHLSNISFIYSGSQKHLLTAMFTDYSRPFYSSSDILSLSYIDAHTYKSYIINHFNNNKRNIDDESVDFILNFSRCHTYYVQVLCNRLYGLDKKNINMSVCMETAHTHLKEQEPIYYSFRDLLSQTQFKLLKAIAKEKKADKLLSSKFLKQYDLGAGSSVASALEILQNKNMLFKEENYWFVADVFFSRWLEQY